MTTSFKPCSVPNCDGNAHYTAYGRMGWCNAHYIRWRRHGDPKLGDAMHGEPNRWLLEVAFTYAGADCLIWPFARNNYGYGVVAIEGKTRVASRVICEKIHGPAPTAEHQAAHSCGNGHLGCVNKGHLRWATRPENYSDSVEHGTNAFGERHGHAKLKDNEVALVHTLSSQDLSQAEIARQFDISQQHVSDIVRNKYRRS